MDVAHVIRHPAPLLHVGQDLFRIRSRIVVQCAPRAVTDKTIGSDARFGLKRFDRRRHGVIKQLRIKFFSVIRCNFSDFKTLAQ